jgi:hypothetical protein
LVLNKHVFWCYDTHRARSKPGWAYEGDT